MSKKANRYLRWGMIEAAQKAKVMDPFLRVKAEEIKRESGASVTTAAVARHLLVAVYHIFKEKTIYQQPKLKYNSPGKPVRTLVAEGRAVFCNWEARHRIKTVFPLWEDEEIDGIHPEGKTKT